MFFGILVGVSILLSAFYANGAFDEDGSGAERVPTGMELLEAYQCDKAETKQIIIGGAEDNYDPAGVETSNPSERLIRYLVDAEAGRTPSDIIKTYDDPTQDKHFSDRFEIPRRTFHGIIALRVEELSGLKNDGLSFGYRLDGPLPHTLGYGYREVISNLPTLTEWAGHNSLFYASLEDLEANYAGNEKDLRHGNTTLLELIRAKSDSYGDFFVEIADDSIVDFVGFAICLEPEDDKGTVYSRYGTATPGVITDFGPGNVGLFPARIDGSICGYSGCLSCETARPVACIRDNNADIPNGYDPNFTPFWTGGDFKFTEAIKGSNFQTEDDVDQFCAAEFGPEWRALSRHDGWSGGVMSGKARFPSDYENVWINVKNSDHHNCWTPRPDYEVVDDG